MPTAQSPQASFIGAELAPRVSELMHLREVAAGRAKPDLIIRGGKVLALHTGEILQRDVVIAGRHIAAVTPPGRFDAKKIIDAKGQFVAPNFIDVHIHIEYTMLTPGELARLTVPRGTTTLLADGNCIANVLGAEGLDIVGRTGTPLRIFRQVSHRVPRTPALELGGAQGRRRGDRSARAMVRCGDAWRIQPVRSRRVVGSQTGRRHPLRQAHHRPYRAASG